MIKKEYAQSNQRDLCNAQRNKQKTSTSSDANIVSHTPSPFVQIMSPKTPLDDSSSDDGTQPPSTPEKRNKRILGLKN